MRSLVDPWLIDCYIIISINNNKRPLTPKSMPLSSIIISIIELKYILLS